MKKLKTQKGITLVALIITIVVLLILAAVAIGTVRNSDIIGYSQNAAGGYNQAKANELEALAGYENIIENTIKVEEPVWGEYQGALCYFGNEKDLIVSSNTIQVEELELNETSNGFNRTGIIKETTFANCIGIQLMFAPNLETVDFGNNLSSNIMVYGMASVKLREIKGLGGITIFYNDSFATCTSLESVEIPMTATTIDTNAFFGCERLKNITIPSNITSIASNAFSGCTSLTEVTINKTKAEVEAEGGIGTAWIPESVTKIIYSDQTVER